MEGLLAGVGEGVEDHEFVDFEGVWGVGGACCDAEVVVLGHLDLRFGFSRRLFWAVKEVDAYLVC